MPTQESMRETLEHFRNQERKLLDDLRSLGMTIRQIERELGIEEQASGSTELSNGFLAGQVEAPAVTGVGGKPPIRPDEFFGMTHAEAAKRYLKKVGHAVSFEELADALQKGGCKVGGAQPKRVLYISLVRNTRDFVPPQTGYVGLREFYPNIAKAQPLRVSTGAKRGRPAKRTKSKRGSPASAEKSGTEKDAPNK